MNTEELEEALMLFAELTQHQQKIFVELFLPDKYAEGNKKANNPDALTPKNGADAQRENIAERGERGGTY